jgi:hypothetical protein
LPAQAAPADGQAPAVTTADAPAMNASVAGATAPMSTPRLPRPLPSRRLRRFPHARAIPTL